MPQRPEPMRLRLALLLVLLPITGWAARSVPVTTARVTARLLTDTDVVQPGRPFRIGVQLVLAPGWHSYWHNPGDAGAPPTLDLAGPDLTAGGVQWPLPQRLPDGPVMSFGYTGLVLLSRTAVYAGTAPLTVTAEATYLVCEKLCVPEHGHFTLTLPVGPAAASADRPLFDATAARVPGPAAWPATIAPDGTMRIDGAPPGLARFFPDAADATVLAAPQPADRAGSVLSLHLTPRAPFQPGRPITGVLAIGDQGWRLGATPQAAPLGTSRAAFTPLTLLLAFAGGLVLNLMPCVFPILAMKVIGLAGLGGAQRRTVRLHAVAYSLGVLASFAAVALVLLGLRATGQGAGWGFQFQSPPFVAAMAWLFFAIGLNLSGVYVIGGGWTGIGQRLAARGGVLGSAGTGMLAVVVATPCTAPFMGAAVAYAAAAPALQALTVFAALGLGFGLPWTVLAFFPRAAALLPRPGGWMEGLRQSLAFPMYAAALWLVWVVSRQAGSWGVLAVGAGLLLVGFAAWVAGFGRIGRVCAVAALCGAVAILPAITPAAAPQAAQVEAYTPDRLAALRAAGTPVLVNMTASWCVTCLVNERTAIEPALAGLRAHGVTYLQGDWTSQDRRITAFLRAYGRAGVPLYVFFPAGAAPQVLPQLLTRGRLLALR